MQQIKAVREALTKLARILLTDEICLCERKKKSKEFVKMVEELVKSL